MCRDNSELRDGNLGNLEQIDSAGRASSDAGPNRSRTAPGLRSLPDDVWDVFRLDDSDTADQPEPGDFWLEPDELDEP